MQDILRILNGHHRDLKNSWEDAINVQKQKGIEIMGQKKNSNEIKLLYDLQGSRQSEHSKNPKKTSEEF